MPETLRGVDPGRLERSCSRGSNWIRFGPSAPRPRARGGLPLDLRVRAAPARHVRDRRHDGGRADLSLPRLAPGLPAGSAACPAPGRDARRCRGKPRRLRLPDPLHRSRARSRRPLGSLAAVRRRPGPGAGAVSTTHRVSARRHRRADQRARLCRDRGRGRRRASSRSAVAASPARPTRRQRCRARARLSRGARKRANPGFDLEEIAGLDRFTIARQFRSAFGTSPDRYRTLRRLALARAAIESGRPLARAAVEAGFADQSHMTRQFRRTYGLTPARWTALTTVSAAGA